MCLLVERKMELSILLPPKRERDRKKEIVPFIGAARAAQKHLCYVNLLTADALLAFLSLVRLVVVVVVGLDNISST